MASTFVTATVLICSLAVPNRDCLPTTAEIVLHATVPKAMCQPAMQQFVAERLQVQPLTRTEYPKVIDCDHEAPADATLLDVGVGATAAPAGSHVFTPGEIAKLKAWMKAHAQ
jgi:hypothetical protein